MQPAEGGAERRAQLARTQAFFGERAARWEDRFPDDDPSYAAAVVELRPHPGGTVLDLGCGTGRAFAPLRAAVGNAGVVVGIDATKEMLDVACTTHGETAARVMLADATEIPFPPRSVDAIFAAGLLTHVPDPRALLVEMARVARPGCRLALFHPVGRAVLAARHNRPLRPDEILDPAVLPGALAAAGWVLERIDDGDDRYLALAEHAEIAAIGVTPRARPAGDFDYEQHGGGYATHRRADPTIAALINGALGPARTVVNVGAGAGSYEPTQRTVVAVEPSAAMRAQRPRDAAPVVAAVAADLPFAARTFAAAMATITVHQWPDAAAGLREMRRVTRGPVAILTFDGTTMADFWMAEYAPEFIAAESARYPTIEEIGAALGDSARTTVVPIPLDCTDGFIEAFYGRPEALLDPAVRAAQSAWGFVDPATHARAIERLADDLRSGRWDERHGALRTQAQYAGSLRLVVSTP